MTADQQAIQGILQHVEAAWNRYDSASFSAVFAEVSNEGIGIGVLGNETIDHPHYARQSSLRKVGHLGAFYPLARFGIAP